MPSPSLRPWAALALLAPLQIFWAVTRTFDTYDETWFLQVASRVVSGETLYRDVYFNTTPLSMYVTAAGVALVGAQLLVVKLVTAFSVLASILAGGAIIERAAPSQRGIPLILIALVLVYGNYPSVTPYTPMAVAFFLLTLLGWVRWVEERRASLLLWSGVAAGLCFAAKHNIGALAAMALGGAIIAVWGVDGRRATAIGRALAAAAGGFALVVVPMLVVIAATGGLEAFIEYAVVNKRTYVAVGSASYLHGLRRIAEHARGPVTLGSLMGVYRLLVLVVPPIALVLTARQIMRTSGEQRKRALGLAMFLVAGLASTYPRASGAMPYVVPILGTISVIAWRAGGAPRHRLLRVTCATAVAAWLGLALAQMLANQTRRLGSAEWQFSKIPHCRGILVEKATDATLLREAHELRAALPGNEAFIQALTAGFYYLAAGISNPTPYDMPAVTTFGPDGQRKVIAWIASGRVKHVAVLPAPQPAQVPRELMHAVRTLMVPRVRSDRFTLFSRATQAERP